MPTKVKKISSKIFAVLCAVTVLLGVFVTFTSAVSTERTTDFSQVAIFNPDNPLYEIIIPSHTLVDGEYEDDPTEVRFFISARDLRDVGSDLQYNLVSFNITYYAQNEDGDLELYSVYSPPVPYLTILESYSSSLNYAYSDDYWEIAYAYIPYRFNLSYFAPTYPDSIESISCNIYPPQNYQYGYDEGYAEGGSGSYDEGFNNGYDQGYTEGESNGYTEGYNNGYGTASSEIENQNALGLFGRGIFDGLLDIYFDTFRIPIFGTSLGEILGYFIFFIWVLVVVKIVSFVI